MLNYSLVYKGKVHHFFSQLQELPFKEKKPKPINFNILWILISGSHAVVHASALGKLCNKEDSKKSFRFNLLSYI